MLLLKYAVLTAATGFFMTAVLVVVFEAQRVWRLSQTMGAVEWPAPRPLLWRKAARLVGVGGLVMLPVLSMILIPLAINSARATGRPESYVLSSQPCTRVGR